MRQWSKTQKITLLAWLAYIPYYLYMQYWENSVIAPIRVDLLIIYPLLAILTLASLVQLGQRWYR